MHVISTSDELHQRLAEETSVSFVPTMGNLHAGHIYLVDLAKQQGQCVVVSIFVNPLQFGANEDLASYPRTFDADCAKLQLAGADIVFAPTEQEMYPVTQTVFVEPSVIAHELCGATRPGHFRGMATVVLKLFNLVQPQVAVFGNKDFQQLFIIREMVRQLNLPIHIVAGETMRDSQGLAMSSRNGYLTAAQRQQAPQLYQALQQASTSVIDGKHDYSTIEAQTANYLTQSGWIVDYISLRSALTLAAASDKDNHLVVLGAARLGATRLIDNIEFRLV